MKPNNLCVLLLAGGVGSRMGSSLPKQFIILKNKPVVHYSFDLFGKLPEVLEIVVICQPEFRYLFEKSLNQSVRITYALPGNRRQDSVYNGFKAMHSRAELICIHDAARPFITKDIVRRVSVGAALHGASAAAMKVKFTIKESNSHHMVMNTPDRSNVWEIQTPQVIKRSLLARGFAYAIENNLDVTDDVSLIEHLKLPVQLVEGSYRNIKITTPEDLAIAHAFLETAAKCS